MTTPTLIYDGDCGVCTASVDWVRRWLSDQPVMRASQSVDPSSYGLSLRDVQERVWLCTVSGAWGGHEAVAGVFKMQSDWRWRLLGNLMLTPPFAWFARLGYWLIARNRHRIRVGAVQCAVPDSGRVS